MNVIAYVVFFASGFAALVYQITWQRLLVIFSGSDVHSATIVVAAFMAGLGCGSLAAARIADRLSRSMSFTAFAVAELCIGLFGFFSTDIYYGVLYRQLGDRGLGMELRALVLFVSLLWPTFFMGMSLPLLARALTHGIASAAKVTGALYACNTIGAAVGAITATWLMMPTMGLRGSILLSAAMNIFAAAATLPLLRGAGTNSVVRETPIETPSVDMDHEDLRLPFAAWAAIYGLAGLMALSLEILWFRLMGVMLKSTAFTFGTLLAIYLGGMGAGAALGSVVVGRIRRPAQWFLLFQAGIGVYAGLGLTLLVAWVGKGDNSASLIEYFGRYEPLDVAASITALGAFVRGAGPLPGEFLKLCVVLPAVLIGPPTIFMGASLPLLQKRVQTNPTQVGQRVGTLLACNIAGSALGSVLTGWVSLGLLGTAGTMKVLVATSALFPAFGLTLPSNRRPASRTVFAVTIAACAVLFVVMPRERAVWAALHGTRPPFVVTGEDGSGVSVLRKAPADPHTVVFVNGIGQSWIPYGGIHTVLGALPAFIHDRPRTAVIIGLGSGDTVFGVAGRGELERITCIEIVKPQLATLRQVFGNWPYPGLRSVLSDPRIDHRYGDGRLFLLHSDERYDIIEADALRPTSAYSGSLYSDAYFTLVRDRLNPNGLAVSWAPTPRVHDTFVKVFPHVLSYGDIVIGSNEAISLDVNAVRRRLTTRAAQDHFGGAGVEISALVEPYLGRTPRIITPADDRSGLLDINTELFPKDEFNLRKR